MCIRDSFKDAQVLSAGYGRRMEQAEAIFSDLSGQGYDRSSRWEDTKNWLFPGELQGENLRKQDQAERNFINANLRKESGAAIAPEEFASAEKQYFPRPGDTPDILKIKAANRQQATLAMKTGAGPAWNATPFVDPLEGTSHDSSAGPVGVDLDFDNMSDEELQKYLGQ